MMFEYFSWKSPYPSDLMVFPMCKIQHTKGIMEEIMERSHNWKAFTLQTIQLLM